MTQQIRAGHACRVRALRRMAAAGCVAALLCGAPLLEARTVSAPPSVNPVPVERERAPGVPPLVWDAITAGNPVKQAQWAYTQTITSGEMRLVLRYDPRTVDAYAEGVGEGNSNRHLQLVDPPEEALTDDLRSFLAQVRKGDNARQALSYRALAQTIGTQVRLTDEEGETKTYSFQPVPRADDDSDAGRLVENVRGTLTVTLNGPNGPWVSRIVLKAPEPFKPNLMVKVEAYEQRAEYMLQDGLPVLRLASTSVSGSAMFRDFSEAVTITFSDIEKISGD